MINPLKIWAFPFLRLEEKATVRRAMREKRSSLDLRSAKRKNERLIERFWNISVWRKARTIALFASTPEEVQTDLLAIRSRDEGKILAYPTVNGKNLIFRRVDDLNTQLNQRGAFGIREPDDSREIIPLEAIDLFIVPGLAFDPFGGRIGYGGGYYDRVLVQKRPDAQALAIAFEFQVLHAVPTGEYDQPVDAILTEETVYAPRFSTVSCTQENETRSWPQRLLQRGLPPGTTLALHADLGVGKTVFTQGMAEALGIHRDVISPTFIYCREYDGTIPLIHVDAYRLNQEPDSDDEFWNEILEKPGIRLVEWAERLGRVIPKNAVHCWGQIRDNEIREWTLFTPLFDQGNLHETQ